MIGSESVGKKLLLWTAVAIFASLFVTVWSHTSNRLSQETSGSGKQISFDRIMSRDGVSNWIVDDFDGDGSVEIAITDGTGVLVMELVGGTLRTSDHLVGLMGVVSIQALDLNSDGVPEIVIGLKKDDVIWSEIWTNSLSEGKKQYTLLIKTAEVRGSDVNGDGFWDGAIGDYQLLDADGDGQLDILAILTTGYDMIQRSLITFSGNTGDKIWEYPITGHASRPLCADINGDGSVEIIVGDRAPCNGYAFDDIDDCHSYLTCLDKEGRLLWRHEMGGAFTHTSSLISDTVEDGYAHIICTFAGGDAADESTRFQLQRRSGVTGEVEKSFSIASEFDIPLLADIDRDGKKEIVVSNMDGNIYLFDQELEMLMSTRLGSGLDVCMVSQILDMNDDGDREILAGSSHELSVFDRQFKLIGSYQADMGFIRKRPFFFEHPDLGGVIAFIQGNPEGAGQGVLLGISFTDTVSSRGTILSKTILRLILSLLIAGIVMLYLGFKVLPGLFHKYKSTGSIPENELRDRFLETLSVFGHGKTATANLDRLNLLFRNLPPDTTPSPEHSEKIQETITAYFGFTSQMLSEIVEKAKLARVAEKQAVEMESSLSLLERNLEDVRRNGITGRRSKELSSLIPEILDSIDAQTGSIRQELTRYYRCDVKSSIKEVLTVLSSNLKKECVTVHDIVVEGDQTPHGFIDRVDFKVIFEELIVNAIRAMKDSDSKELGIRIITRDTRISVEVSDTGSGLKDEDCGKIFDLEYSTKEDGGFGLYHAKTTFNKYGGKIRVVRSEPGKGTTMVVEIKKV